MSSDKEKKDYTAKIGSFFRELDNAILEMSDEEYKEYLAEKGVDLEEDANYVHNIFKSADKVFKQRELNKARSEYKAKIAKLEIPNKIPESFDEKKTLLEKIVTSIPQLSFQYRNIQNMTDDDLESALNQLINLGNIDKDDDNNY